jgi:hypothetical protein
MSELELLERKEYLCSITRIEARNIIEEEYTMNVGSSVILLNEKQYAELKVKLR